MTIMSLKSWNCDICCHYFSLYEEIWRKLDDKYPAALYKGSFIL